MTGESFDLGGVLKRVQELQHRIVLAQADLAETEVTRTAAGMVSVTMTGNGEVTRVTFNQAVLDGDAESLGALTLSAIGQVAAAVKELSAERLGAVAAGLEVPPGTQLTRR
jgi:nucleoid-associated protein EbfC